MNTETIVYDVRPKPIKLRVIEYCNTFEEAMATVVEIENSEKALMEHINSGFYKGTDWIDLTRFAIDPKFGWDDMYQIRVSHDNGPKLVFGYCDRKPGDTTPPWPVLTVPMSPFARAMWKKANESKTPEGIT